MLSTASSQYDVQNRLIVVGLAAARRAWRLERVDLLATTLATLQARAARESEAAVAAMVDEQGIAAPVTAALAARAFTETSEGLPLGDLLERATSLPTLGSMVTTQLADTSRSAAAVATAVRPKLQGYVRHVGPTCCSRCAILAGRFYRYSDGFLRHPNCKCTMVPTTTGGFGEVVDTPADLFEQGRIRDLSKADAAAIEAGADLGKVVNVRRSGAGLSIAGVVQARGSKLTPAGIFRLASDRDEAIRLLAKHGYIT